MINFDDILLDEEISQAKFACRLDKCHGACCTFPGDFGAPVLDEEVPRLRAAVDIVRKYLPKKALDTIEREGVVEGLPGKFTTICINKRDCVFVYYEGKVAKCALEKAWFSGELNFRKPISCHLFPIRVGNYGGKYLYYEKIDECAPAVCEGQSRDIPLIETVADALTRAYGAEWVERLKKYIANGKEQNTGGNNDEAVT
ncbi:MAG: DUF3109 family protein [Candidatus Kapaibacterium sp.]